MVLQPDAQNSKTKLLIVLSDFFKLTPQDYGSLPYKIDLLLNLSEEQKIKILQNVKTVIEKNFSRENMVNKYLKFYESTQS